MILLFYYLGFIITVFIFKNLKTAIIWLFNLNFSQSIHDKRGENLNLVITISLFMLSSSYLINSQSLLSIYLSMELQSFCTLLILFLMSDSLAESPEAIFKYFVISSITGLLYLCGFYFSTFELNVYLDSASVLNKNNLNLFVMSLPFIVKLGMFPSYLWVPEVYRGISYLGVAFLSLIPKITSFLILLKFLGPGQLFLIIGVSSIIIGSFGGLNQSNVKVLLSFSGIGHFGLIFVLISLGFNFCNLSSFYLIVYCLSASSLLFTLSSLKKNNIIELGGFLSHSTALGSILGILLLSLMGFPPLSGFICKLVVIISSLLQSINTLAILIMIISLVISAFYYLRAFIISSNGTESSYQCYSLASKRIDTPQFCYPFLIVWPVFLTGFLFLNPLEIFMVSSFII